jgi:imidazolonepropionase-like amidohydrolase
MGADGVAIVGGLLLDGTGADPLPDATVVVVGNRITAVGPRATTAIPPDAQVLDAAGRTILPGLVDVHQHSLHEWDQAQFPQVGVTAIRFAGNQQSDVLALRDRVRAGELLGPRIFSVGPTIDAPPTARPQSALVVRDPDEARREARRLIEHEQVDALFAARRIDADLLRALLETAHAHGKPVTGQVYALSGRQAAELGIDGLENTSRIPESPVFDDAALHGYRSVSHRLGMLGRLWATAPESTMQEILGVMAEHAVEWAPCLVSFEHWAGFLDDYMHSDADYQRAPAGLQQEFWDFEAELSRDYTDETRADWARGLERLKHWIGYYHSVGGTVVTGTDTYLGPITYHRELRHLREAGLSLAEIVVAATSRGAHALRQPDLGTLALGKLADVIVVAGNPLQHLDALRYPVHVLVDGRAVVVEGQRVDHPC